VKFSARIALAFLFMGTSLAGTSWAAGPAGPVAGFTLDSRTATIRAITGLPGALRLADPLALPFGVVAAEFTQSGGAALVLTSQRPAHLVMVSALNSTLTSTPAQADLGEVPDGSRILALNRRGTAGILYSPATQEVRFATGLDTTPSLGGPVPAAGAVTAGLLEEGGQCAILGTGSVDTLCTDGTTRRVLAGTELLVAALAFGNSGKDLWIADAAGKQVLCVVGYAQQSSFTVFASGTDGISKPVALSVAPSGQVLVADADAPALFVLDPSGAQPIQTIQLDTVPSQLRPLTDRSLLLINDLSALPFTLFASTEMRTYFVPAN